MVVKRYPAVTLGSEVEEGAWNRTNTQWTWDNCTHIYHMFTEYWSDFMPLPLPLSPKSQQDILSLPLMPTKYRRACSNERTLSTLQTQEKKIFTLQSGISFDSFSWHPHCAPEMDRISIHVEGKVESWPKLVTLLQKISWNQPLPSKTKNGEEIFRKT